MKSELIQRIEELLQAEDITSIKQQVRELQSDFKAETAKETQLQKEKFEAEEQEEGASFQYSPGDEDEKFYSFIDVYKERVKEHGQQIAEEQKKNFEEKKSLLDELENIIQNEENIKTAFDGFHAVKDKYELVGDIPGDKYKDLQDRYQALRDAFFYNINIYKELRENDLKINQKLKEELIEKAKSLKAIETIKEKDQLVRLYQKEWSDIGPSPRETYKEMADEFFGLCREAIEDIRQHFEGLKEVQEANLALKVALVDKMKELLSNEIKNHGTWMKKTDDVLAMQSGWKEIGFAPKKENEEVWQEFRGLCDLFFEKKSAYYDERKAEQKQHTAAKAALIEKATSLQGNTDWKKTTEEYLKLQKQWKAAGSASPREEQKLWQQFRSACDKFFNAKKEHFSGMNDRQDENLKIKLELIKEIEGFKLSGQKNADIQALKEFSDRFNAIGYVPKPKVQEVFDNYHLALDKHYGAIDLGQEERRMMQYKTRVADIKKSDNNDKLLQKERRLLYDKMDRLKDSVLRYENNMGIFTGSGADAMKKEIEKKISSANKEIEEIQNKLDLL